MQSLAGSDSQEIPDINRETDIIRYQPIISAKTSRIIRANDLSSIAGKILSSVRINWGNVVFTS